MKIHSDPTAKGMSFLKTIAGQHGVCVGGSYDDARVTKQLHRAGFIEIRNLPSGTAMWQLTCLGASIMDRNRCHNGNRTMASEVKGYAEGHSNITTQFTVWCGGCAEGDQVTAKNRRKAGFVWREVGWRFTKDRGWLCQKCRTA